MGVFKKKNLEKYKQTHVSEPQHRILLVDDDPENLCAFSSFLEKDYHITTARDGQEALDLIHSVPSDHFQVIVTDQRMPRMTGVSFLEQSLEVMPDAKRIILTGYTDAEAIIDSVNRARIYEFILKPIERNKLLLTLKRAIEAYELESRNKRLVKDLKDLNSSLEQMVMERTRELRAAMEKLEEMATTDQLTGAFNRRKFDEILTREISQVERYGQGLCLVIFDIDHFKKINDRHGHLVGDDVLRILALLVGDNLRETDTLFRWGGEEFLILIPHADLEGAKALAEKIREVVAAHNFPEVDQVTISLGVTQFREGDNHDHFISRTDEALYQAKNSGRNRVVSN